MHIALTFNWNSTGTVSSAIMTSSSFDLLTFTNPHLVLRNQYSFVSVSPSNNVLHNRMDLDESFSSFADFFLSIFCLLVFLLR